MNAPLSSLRVAVHASGVAAAYAARMLGGMGAEVVLVEPSGGTPLRREPPFLPVQAKKPLPLSYARLRLRGGVGVGLVMRTQYQTDSPHPPTPSPEGEGGKVSALFAYLTHGANFQTCDLTTVEGQSSLAALLSQCDIFIDDTPLDGRAALGIDEAAIAARHPGLVHVSVLPFGATGEKAHWKGEEINLQHASGEGYLLPNGLSVEQFPDRPPVKIHGHFASMQGGIAAALGALAALRARGQGGGQVSGQYVDISCQDAMLSVGAFAIQRFGDGQVEHRVERSFRYGGVLPCADGFVELLTLEQRQWDGLVELLGRPDWALDPALADSLERSRRGPELNRHIRAWAATRKVADIVREGQKLSVPLAKYNTPAEVLRDPHERERGLFQPVEVPGAGSLDMLVSPVQFDGKASTL